MKENVDRKEPVLVIMAAGMGSRYGGLKQIDPVDQEGHIIIDFSIFDAIKAGFKKVIFIIKKETEADFKKAIVDRLSQFIEIELVYQEITNLPEGYKVPEGRIKPWGTGHAILCCMNSIHGPFAAINADDYYGREAFQLIYDYLKNAGEGKVHPYAMVGYVLDNTLTEHGHVARGVCEMGENGYLKGIKERLHIERRDGHAAYTEDDGKTFTALPEDTTVSMNMWGFTDSMMKELKLRFAAFLNENLEKNPLKSEYFLPSVVGELIKEGKATVEVLKTNEKWYGVTYKEDKEFVMKAMEDLKKKGLYPEHLWQD